MKQKVESLINSIKNPKLKSLTISYSNGEIDYIAAETSSSAKSTSIHTACVNQKSIESCLDSILEDIKEIPEDFL